jgi:hypothetical protein
VDTLSRELIAAFSKDETIRSLAKTMETLRDYPMPNVSMPNVSLNLEAMFSVDESRAVAEEAGRSFLKTIEDLRTEHLPKLAKSLQELFGLEETEVPAECQTKESAAEGRRDETPASLPDQIRSLAFVVSEDVSKRKCQFISQVRSVFDKLFVQADVDSSAQVTNTAMAANMLAWSSHGETMPATLLPMKVLDPHEEGPHPSIEITFVGSNQFDVVVPEETSGTLFSQSPVANKAKIVDDDDESIEILMTTSPAKKSRLVGRWIEAREDKPIRWESTSGAVTSESRDPGPSHQTHSWRPRLLPRLPRRRSQEDARRRRAATSTTTSRNKPQPPTTIDPKIGYSF